MKTCAFCAQFLSLEGGLFDSENRGEMKDEAISKDDMATLKTMGISVKEAEKMLLSNR